MGGLHRLSFGMEKQQVKKIKIYTVVCNRPDLVEIQAECFRKFFKENVEVVVVDNSEHPTHEAQFSSICTKIGCSYIRANPNRAEPRPGFKHAECLNFLWQNYASNDTDCYVLVCDPDLFLISPVSLEERFGESYAIASAMQHRLGHHHITPILAIFDMSRIPDPKSLYWDAGYFAEGIANLDTGGRTYEYIKIHNIKDKILNMKMSGQIISDENIHCLPDEMISSYDMSYCMEFHGKEFFHYSKGSNWNGNSLDFHERKTIFLNNMIHGILNDTIKAKDHDVQIEDACWGSWDGKNWGEA